MREHLLRFSKFVCTGLLNTAIGYALYATTIVAGVKPSLALALATAIGATCNYFTTGWMVFSETRLHHLPRFLLVYAGIYVLNVAILELFLRTGLRPLAAQAAALPFIVPISYAAMTFWVFRRGELK